MAGYNPLSSAFRGGLKPKPARAYIIPLDIHHSDLILTGERKSFQYFPETVNDTRATNYQTKVIPGLSHPLYQWTSSGAREITFQVIFTRDRALSDDEKKSLNSSSTSSKRAIVTDDIFNKQDLKNNRDVSLSSAATFGRSTDLRNVDIPSAVAWLRSFTYPEYSQDGNGQNSGTPQRPYPPRKLILGLPGTRINYGVPSLPPSEVYCIMLGCPVTYTSFFADGTPRVARVDLSFAEIIQVAGGVYVQDAYDRRSVGNKGYGLNER